MKKLIVIAALGIWGACANYASFQEADTLPKGTSKFGVGATGTTYKDTETNDDGTTSTISVTVPALNLWYRRGIADKLEAHAAVWIPFGSSIGVKYQLSGNRDMAGLSISLGLDVGYLQLGAGDTKVTIIDTYIPVYIGYRTGPGFALYASPKYILRGGFGDETAFNHLAGSTFGVALGAKTTLHIEGTVMYDVDYAAPALQGGVGLAF
jgi:hypothetical protein